MSTSDFVELSTGSLGKHSGLSTQPSSESLLSSGCSFTPKIKSGYKPFVKGFVAFLNMTYFATFILYPIEFIAFAFATSPYIMESKTQRNIAQFGRHGEYWSLFVYFALTFTTLLVTAWIQLTFNEDLNRFLEGDPYLCDPFTEDCSACFSSCVLGVEERRSKIGCKGCKRSCRQESRG